MTGRRVVLLRHGQTEHNAESRMQGQLDTSLSELGERQARAAGAAFAGMHPHAIVSSDLHRAYDTALAVGAATGVAVQTDPRLRETHLGEWQGRTHYEVDAVHPGARDHWRADATWAPPGGESRVQVAARAVPVVEEFVTRMDRRGTWADRPLLVVAHGGVIAAVTAALLGLPVDRWPVIGGIGNTGWAELGSRMGRSSPQWRLNVWNADAGSGDGIVG
ncbi:histidine phosphatase family protein [Tomitella fengzijianii]|uniref:histidine phosphatase family protein n=1 Tax=Tomitella fengzijianii TaxID=2597660 RepID=UPI00143DDB2E|nr:histidine phosphatase family protein [Tomitella fengzijianii]